MPTGVYPRSEADKARITKNLRRHQPLSVGARRKIRQKMKGFWRDPFYAEHMRQVHRGKHSSPATEFKKGSQGFKGKHTEKTKQRLSQKSKEYFLKNPREVIGRLKRGQGAKPTKPEKQLMAILESYNLPFKYVGNGEFILGGRCPDFVNVNGKKQLIELFGVYWHDIFDIARRKEHFRQYGFDTLIIWEEELKDQKKLVKKLKRFAREQQWRRSGTS